MAREKFQTLTEPMFYILLCLREECCGADVMARVSALTHGRVSVGPGTLYNLLDSFQQAGMIRETAVAGRKRSYLITDKGRETLEAEYRRLLVLTEDYKACLGEEDLS
ncbi:PadR family transcriptional regulator [uncultured Oscillibacter sp.]|uniref:PadR family transcriptional regulator n=1 Tax=uncultured Oscillibacter sp. TaxID=876091 RepID=UPI0025F4656A|nr:PadR family transcriptional regulator [uncultured Oscillibacter sp.]